MEWLKYWLKIVGLATRETGAYVLSRIAWGVAMVTAGTAVGAISRKVGQDSRWYEVAVSGILGGLSTLVCAAVLVWLWQLVLAPYKRDRRQQEEIDQLSESAKSEKVKIDPRLELLEEAPSLTPEPAPMPEVLANLYSERGISRDRDPDHQLRVWLEVLEELPHPVLQVRTTAPIYSGSVSYHLPGKEPVLIREPDFGKRFPREVTFTLGNAPIPARSSILLNLKSTECTSLVFTRHSSSGEGGHAASGWSMASSSVGVE